ncbi:MAG: hypothetical protein QW175_07120 [Candidatus Bathyarchaeia archaeon]
MQKRWWKEVTGQQVNLRLEEFKCIVAINCNENYIKALEKCFSDAKIYTYSFHGDDDWNNGVSGNGDDVNFHEYLNRLCDPEFLVRGCTIFFNKYESVIDELAESIWQDFLKGGKRPKEELILGAAEVILIKWNCPFLFSNRADELITILKEDRLSQELKDAYDSSRGDLEKLTTIWLGDAKLPHHLELVKGVYAKFTTKHTIGITGASKALHFIHPGLFVPWDAKIREQYHRHSQNHSKEHEIGSPECYAEFIQTCNQITAKLMQKTKWEEIARRHPAYGRSGSLRTIAKMLDECNYCWITKKERWQ